MTTERIGRLREWFAGYCRGFRSADPQEQHGYDLKEHHTHHVCTNMAIIAAANNVQGDRLAVAETIALFHDLGRFRQFQQYGTFKDSDSVNHAALGAQLLVESGVLTDFSPGDRHLIVQAVRLHNTFTLPKQLTSEERFFLQMIRDADKLDIWRVFIDHYQLPIQERATVVELGFPDLPSCSASVLSTMGRQEMVQLAHIATLNDFKLLQLSWVYDLNFTESFRLFMERNYLDRLAAALPGDPAVATAVENIRHFVRTRAAEASATGSA